MNPALEVTVKPWYHSRTLWLNFAGFVLACTAAAEQALPSLAGLYSGKLILVWLGVWLPIFNAALRFLTTTALVARATK